jgi:multiple sugar transport system substrate-binding protein
LSAFGMESYPTKAEEAYLFFTPAAETAFQFLRNLSDDGCAWFSRDPRPYEYFSKRYALFYSSDIRSIYAQSLAMERLRSTDQWTVLAYPDFDGNPNVVTYGPSYAIMLSSIENQLASWLFIRWMDTTSNQIKMVKTEGSLPLSYSAVAELGEYGEVYPMWEGALGWISSAHLPPTLASWIYARVVLEDAAWMALSANVTINNVPTILQQLDNTIQELSPQ